MIDEIKKTAPNVDARFVEADLLNLASVRKGANEIKSLAKEIHGLINSAGIMGVKDFQLSKDGIESQFAINHISHFVLTNMLKDELVKGSGAVVNVSSGGYELSDVDYDEANFNEGKDYNSWLAYGHGKTANLLFSLSLASSGKKHGVAAFGVNPGRMFPASFPNSCSDFQMS